jgi:hypothetical protein
MRWADFSGKDAAVTAAAVENHFAILFRVKALDIAFKNAAAKMLRFGGVTGLPFAVFANIHEDAASRFSRKRARACSIVISFTRGRASLTTFRNPGE